MRTQKRTQFTMILILAAAMVMMLALAASQTPEKPVIERMTFRDTSTGQRLVPAYDGIQDKYVLYLPAHTAAEDIQPRLPGAWVRPEYAEQELELTIWSLTGKDIQTLALQQCSGVPSLFIEAEEGTLSHIHESKEHEKQTLVLLRDESGQLVFSQVATLSGRGNSSWDNKAKRPYELKFDSPVSFGPFEDTPRLCLLAEYADESKLHNSVAYYAARELGLDYASGYTYVNVYFSGEYLGLYGVATKDEYTKYTQSDGIQGVFEVTSNLDKQDFWPALSRNPVRVLYGRADQVEAAVLGFEDALISGDWETLAARIDADSFARKVVLEELLGNSDMTYASQYFYLDGNGVIHCMLPWDYDLSLGYTIRYYNNKQIWEMESYRDPDGWYALLTAQSQFRQQVLAVLKEIRENGLVPKCISHMEQTADRIGASRDTDFFRWRTENQFNWFDRSCGEDTLEGMVSIYGDYLTQRLDFLTAYFEDWDNYCRIDFLGDQYANLCIPKGESLWDYLAGANILAGEKINSAFKGWFTEAGRQPEEIAIVTENIQFQARYE